jgi:multiple sugar transport system substrate-binding protein
MLYYETQFGIRCKDAKMQRCKVPKLFFFLLFAFCFLPFTLTGCTQKSNKTIIQFASWGSQSEVAIIKPILAEFEQNNPDIKVEFVHIPQNYFQKIHLLFASNLAPDVLFINNLYLPIYANANVLQEFTIDKNGIIREQGTGNGEQNKSSFLFPLSSSLFYKKALKALSYNNKLYAIPRDVSTLVVYYNKDIFKKYNVPLPGKYWTFDDFLILAQKLTKDTNNDGKTDIWGVSFDEDLLFYLPYLMSEGGGVLSDDLKTSIIDSPKSQKGLKFYADLRNKYHVAPTEAESASATMAQLFLQGKLAMQVSGRWLVPKYREDAKFEWNVINFPAGDKGSVVPLDASGWAIAKSSKHKKEAARLIEFLASKQSSEKFTQSGLIVPARIDVAQGAFLSFDKNAPQNKKVFIDIIKTAKNTPVSVNYNEIQDNLKEKTNYLLNK